MGFDEKMLIRVEFRIRNATVAAIKRQLSLLANEDDEALYVLRDAIENSKITPVAGHIKVCLEYSLTLLELKNYGGTVYYGELDLVVSLNPPETVIPHPHSERGRRASIATISASDKDPKAFGYSILTVDNFSQYGPRFINIGGNVYRVNPVQDFAHKDGVYLTSDRPVNGDLFMPIVENVHYSFEAAEEALGLYKTHEEAETLGDLGTARKEVLAKLEQANLVMSKDLAHLKQRQSIEQAEADRQRQEMEAAHNREKLTLQETLATKEAAWKEQEIQAEKRKAELKEFYENRSLARKDSSEVIKVIPAIILGIGTIGAVLWKIFSK